MSPLMRAPRAGRLLFLGLCAAVLAALVHLAAILLVPLVADGHGQRVAGDAPVHVTTLAAPARDGGGALDPATAIALCPFDLTRHPVRVKARTGDELLTISFHSLDGRVFYALSDRAAQKGLIELVLFNRQQMDDVLNLDSEDEVLQDVRLLSPVQKGLVVVRVLSLLPGEKPAAIARARQMTCEPDPAILAGGE